TTACPAASRASDGARQLEIEPTATRPTPIARSDRRRTRPTAAPTQSATTAATTAATVRIWLAAAVETPNAAATSVSTGVKASCPAWAAKRHEKRIAAT